jgi:iron complex transport system substrate-binding protein
MSGRRGRQALVLAWVVTAGSAWAAPSQRLVVAGGALTEIVYDLGLAQRLAGVDTTSVFPRDTERLAKIGYLRNLSTEGILSLHPDVLLATADAGPPSVLQQLRSAGLPLRIVAAPHSPGGVADKIAAVAGALGEADRGNRPIGRYRAQWRETEQFVARQTIRPRVLFLLAHGSGIQVAGRETAADAVIRLAGAKNVGGDFSGYRPLNAESAVAANPQAVLLTREGLAALGGHDALWQVPGLKLTEAGSSRRVVAMDAGYLLGFGPRLPQAVRELAERLRRPTP